MYCPKCGERLDDSAQFCRACGTKISRDGSRVDLAAPAVAGYAEPVDASRSLLTWILFTFLTCGIYSWYFIYKLAADMNRMCSGDGEETPGLLVFVLLSMVTCGFYAYWWYYKIGNRMQANAPRYPAAIRGSELRSEGYRSNSLAGCLIFCGTDCAATACGACVSGRLCAPYFTRRMQKGV